MLLTMLAVRHKTRCAKFMAGLPMIIARLWRLEKYASPFLPLVR
jgi:hypothetical protein